MRNVLSKDPVLRGIPLRQRLLRRQHVRSPRKRVTEYSWPKDKLCQQDETEQVRGLFMLRGVTRGPFPCFHVRDTRTTEQTLISIFVILRSFPQFVSVDLSTTRSAPLHSFKSSFARHIYGLSYFPPVGTKRYSSPLCIHPYFPRGSNHEHEFPNICHFQIVCDCSSLLMLYARPIRIVSTWLPCLPEIIPDAVDRNMYP